MSAQSVTASQQAPFRGQRLGLPEVGPGSMAGMGRRIAALFIDWFAASLVARILTDSTSPTSDSMVTLGVFALEVAVLTWAGGASFGQRIVGLRVVGMARRLTLVAAALRALLICLVIPAVVTDADGRGLHDRAVDSVVVRA